MRLVDDPTMLQDVIAAVGALPDLAQLGICGVLAAGALAILDGVRAVLGVVVGRAGRLYEEVEGGETLSRQDASGATMALVHAPDPLLVMRLEGGQWLDDGMAKGFLVRHLDVDGVERFMRPQTHVMWVQDIQSIRAGQVKAQEQFQELAERMKALQRRVDEQDADGGRGGKHE